MNGTWADVLVNSTWSIFQASLALGPPRGSRRSSDAGKGLGKRTVAVNVNGTWGTVMVDLSSLARTGAATGFKALQ